MIRKTYKKARDSLTCHNIQFHVVEQMLISFIWAVNMQKTCSPTLQFHTFRLITTPLSSFHFHHYYMMSLLYVKTPAVFSLLYSIAAKL